MCDEHLPKSLLHDAQQPPYVYPNIVQEIVSVRLFYVNT